MTSDAARFVLPLAAREIVPQSGRMLLIDELTEWEPGRARSRLAVGSSGDGASLFFDPEGNLDRAARVEMLAQLVAAQRGYEQSLKGERPSTGYLVGLKNMVLSSRARRSDELLLECEESLRIEGALIERVRMLRGDEVLAQGDVKVWEQEGPLPLDLSGPSPQTAVRDADRTWRPTSDVAGVIEERSPMCRSLLERLFGFQDSTPGTIEGVFSFGPDFPGFDGHFPGFPILPAVVMVQAGMLLCELSARRRLRLAAISQAKFSKRVGPDELLRVRATFDPALVASGERFSGKVRLTSGDETVAQYTCHVEPMVGGRE
ncbi:hypothetical protein JW916_07530 [Candidatus Sumerlaeota bacterium]|nr:hypothetical protein [Candidatus Sumerlaeota bacterium]